MYKHDIYFMINIGTYLYSSTNKTQQYVKKHLHFRNGYSKKRNIRIIFVVSKGEIYDNVLMAYFTLFILIYVKREHDKKSYKILWHDICTIYVIHFTAINCIIKGGIVVELLPYEKRFMFPLSPFPFKNISL